MLVLPGRKLLAGAVLGGYAGEPVGDSGAVPLAGTTEFPGARDMPEAVAAPEVFSGAGAAVLPAAP